MINFNVFIWILLLLFPLKSMGQTFKAALALGGNASQINGDLIAGFDKLGLHGGVKVMVDIKEKLEGSIEMLWSERGSSSKVRAFDPFKIKINYVEIPLIVGFKDWLKDDYYRMRFEGGVSVGRLVDGKVETTVGNLDVNEFAETDVSMLAGATFYSSKKVGFTIRYSQSINLLFNNARNNQFPRLRGYFLTFRMLYHL